MIKVINNYSKFFTYNDRFIDIYKYLFQKSLNTEDIKSVCDIKYINNIYCINLESCLQRRKQMEKEFKKHNFEVKFISAIHPGHKIFKKKYLNSRWVDQTWDSQRCFCLDDCDHRVRKLRHTEVAISLSHFNIYEDIKRKNLKWSLVCEDDIIFNNNFCQIINYLIPKKIWLMEDPCIIFCGGSNDNYKMEIIDISRFSYRKMPNGCYSNYCYILNLAAAKLLYKNFYPITRPEDSYKRFLIAKEKILCLKITPAIVGELSSGTNFDAVYNRLSQHKPPPRTTQNKQTDYKSPDKQLPPKTKRTIIYSSK